MNEQSLMSIKALFILKERFSSTNFFLATISAFAGYLNDLSDVKVLSSPGVEGTQTTFIRKSKKEKKNQCSEE